MKNQTCYMCREKATSREHTPPKCFFPEKKDMPDKDYRINLISVPSCDEHNSKKSEDDVYLLAVIAAHFGNNKIAANHYATKIFRALKKDIGLQKKILKSAYKTSFHDYKTYALLVDFKRYVNELSNIARAIYFHEFSEKILAPFDIHSWNLRDEHLNIRNDVIEFVSIIDNLFLSTLPTLGNNQQIFSYKIKRIDNPFTVIIKMTFYENYDVLAYSSVK